MSEFYKDKRVIVTGGAGMIGVQLVHLLLEAGATVTVMDNFSRGQNKVIGAEYLMCDAGDFKTCLTEFCSADVVFNLAARVGGVLYNQTHHAVMFYENLRLQATPVKAAKEANIKHFLQTSSVCVYTDDHNAPAQEKNGLIGNPEGANEGYAWAKRMGEMYATWADLNHCVIARPTNAYGAHDYFDARSHVIPALISKALQSGDVLQIHGTGNEQREFIYSSDFAKGLMIALEHGNHNEVYNIGTEQPVTIKQLANEIMKACGVRKSLEFMGGNAGDSIRYTDSSKIQSLGFKPEISLQNGLRLLVDWYRGAFR